jgi:hypothetical protein
MILNELFEQTGEDSTAQQVAEVLRQTHPNPSEATEREILAATGRVLSDQGMSAVRVRFYLRDPDFQSDIIEEVQARLAGVMEMDSQGYKGHRGDEDPGKGPEKVVRPAKSKDVAKDAGKELTKAMDKAHKKPGMAEAMKPSDIPPTMRDRLTMRDIEAERPQGVFRFRVITPQGDQIDFMDQSAAEQRARATGGKVEPIDQQPQGLPDRQRYRVQDPQGSRPAATFTDRKQAERYAAAKKLPIEFIPESEKRNPRIERILKMLRARHPQAEDDLEALIFDFRTQQAQDRTDIARLDSENDAEEADIARLERMLDILKKRRGAIATEPVQEDDIDDAMRDYLARGGKVQQEPARMPRLGTRLRQHGSRHIGQGREPRAGQLSGRGANVAQGGKPVVTAESLRSGEYHVATVTLDDGSVKKVKITSDEGFREPIERHFAKQGRRVQDIDVDYSVRSDLGEAKKKPQPTNRELWSRAKSAARSKFDVYPSAYANAWAAKWYKARGGGWRMGKPKKD